MTGHRPFRNLTKRLPGARKARIEEKAAALDRALTSHERRKARTTSPRDSACKPASPGERK